MCTFSWFLVTFFQPIKNQFNFDRSLNENKHSNLSWKLYLTTIIHKTILKGRVILGIISFVHQLLHCKHVEEFQTNTLCDVYDKEGITFTCSHGNMVSGYNGWTFFYISHTWHDVNCHEHEVNCQQSISCRFLGSEGDLRVYIPSPKNWNVWYRWQEWDPKDKSWKEYVPFSIVGTSNFQGFIFICLDTKWWKNPVTFGRCALPFKRDPYYIAGIPGAWNCNLDDLV